MAVYHNQTIKEVESITIDTILDNNQKMTLQFDIKDGHPVYDQTSLSYFDNIMTLKLNYSAFDMKIIYQ